MSKNIFIKFFLATAALMLFIFTYYLGSNKVIEKSINETNLVRKNVQTKKETSNVIENANYNGTDNRGTFFKLNAKLAQVFNNEPDLSNMEVVNAVIDLKDGRKIYIKSDICVYNRLTNNAKFEGNVLVTESNNKIKSDNLDLIMSENLIKIFNNVKYNGEKGIISSDEIHIDMIKNEAVLFMKNSQDKVMVKYKN